MPVLSLVPSPTTLPLSSLTLIFTPSTGVAGVLRLSVRQPWMWMVSSLRGAGFTQVGEAANGRRMRGSGRWSAPGRHEERDQHREQQRCETFRAGVHGTPVASVGHFRRAGV